MSETSSESKPSSLFVRPAPSTMLGWNALRRVDVPLHIKLALLTILFLTLIPLAMAARARTNTMKKEPRIHIIQDMDNQIKVKAQQASTFFADGRGNRPPVPGTVAQGQLGRLTDFALNEGYTNENGQVKWVEGFPTQIQAILDDQTPAELTMTDPSDPSKIIKYTGTRGEIFVHRGQQVFNYTCINCHGADGSGQGAVDQKATLNGSGASGWVHPAKLWGPDWDKKARANGHIFATINRGTGNMGPQGHIIDSAEDRWAVVAYVRALGVAHAGK